MTFVKIDFEKGEGYYIYRDSITLTQEQFDSLTEQEIEDLKEQRYQAWLTLINTPSEEQPQE